MDEARQFPITSAKGLKLNESQKSEAQKELHLQIYHSSKLSTGVEERYRFSNYIIDPNHRSFNEVITFLGYVIEFKNSLQRRIRIKKIDSSKTDQAITTLNFGLCHLNDKIIQAA